MEKKQDKIKGYTLLEIMIVVVIIGVLTAITVTSVTKVRQNARIKKAKTELEMIAAAVRQLSWDTGAWPSGVSRLDGNVEAWDLTTDSAGLVKTDGSFKNWNGPYLAKMPEDPWGSKYFFDPDYRVDGVNRIVVGSYGPNRTGQNRYYEDNIYVIIQ